MEPYASIFKWLECCELGKTGTLADTSGIHEAILPDEWRQADEFADLPVPPILPVLTDSPAFAPQAGLETLQAKDRVSRLRVLVALTEIDKHTASRYLNRAPAWAGGLQNSPYLPLEEAFDLRSHPLRAASLMRRVFLCVGDHPQDVGRGFAAAVERTVSRALAGAHADCGSFCQAHAECWACRERQLEGDRSSLRCDRHQLDWAVVAAATMAWLEYAVLPSKRRPDAAYAVGQSASASRDHPLMRVAPTPCTVGNLTSLMRAFRTLGVLNDEDWRPRVENLLSLLKYSIYDSASHPSTILAAAECDAFAGVGARGSRPRTVVLRDSCSTDTVLGRANVLKQWPGEVKRLAAKLAREKCGTVLIFQPNCGTESTHALAPYLPWRYFRPPDMCALLCMLFDTRQVTRLAVVLDAYTLWHSLGKDVRKLPAILQPPPVKPPPTAAAVDPDVLRVNRAFKSFARAKMVPGNGVSHTLKASKSPADHTTCCQSTDPLGWTRCPAALMELTRRPARPEAALPTPPKAEFELADLLELQRRAMANEVLWGILTSPAGSGSEADKKSVTRAYASLWRFSCVVGGDLRDSRNLRALRDARDLQIAIMKPAAPYIAVCDLG